VPAARPLPCGVAARARGVADRGLARVPALRLPAASGGGDLMRGRVLVALLGLAVVPARAEERADADLRRLFPEQADVFVAPPGGLSRLKVPAGVLAACRPALSDLRPFARRRPARPLAAA